MKCVCVSLEDKVLSALRQLPGVSVPVEGLLDAAAQGTVKQEDLTALQVRVYGLQQPHEAYGSWTVTAELRLNVEQAESASGQLYRNTHDAVAQWLEYLMIGNRCSALDTEDVFVDGLQRTGGDADFDTSGGVWFATWQMTLSGRLKNTQEEN